MANARTISSEQNIHKIHKFMSEKGKSLTTEEVASETGFHYKTAYRYIKILVERGLVKSDGLIDKSVMWKAVRPSIIPYLPSPNGHISAMGFINAISQMPHDFKSPLLQNEERFNFFLVQLMRQAVAWSDDTREYAEKYYKTYRQQLEMRLSMVNEIIREEKFWNPELCATMVQDQTFNRDKIERAYKVVNDMIQEERRAEFKATLEPTQQPQPEIKSPDF